MIVLIDLDDTLLSNDMDKFQGFYMQFLGDALSSAAPANEVIRQVLEGTKKMITKTAISATLEEVFDRSFYPALNTPRAALQPQIDRFYAEVFPTLRRLTEPRPQMTALMARMVASGWQVAVATKPLFPRTAVVQRLEWPGLPVETSGIALFSTYENFHFSKPNPAYFAELLYQLGWPEVPAVMIGNDLSDDIHPAVSLGLPTFLLLPEGAEPPAPLPALAAAGAVDALWPWLVERAQETCPELPNSPASLLARLRGLPAAVDTLTRGLVAAALRRRLADGEWSITEILCHIRDVDKEVNAPRFQQILTETAPFLPGIVTDHWVEERGSQSEDGRESLAGLIQARQALLEILEPLPAQEWQRPARHAIFGPTNLAELVGFLTVHDRAHIQQIACILRAA